jgi:biopolymer transport protein ExbD
MNFQRGKQREQPEINLIPMIDVLLVILIFLMVTTSYSRFSELKINLPQAQGSKLQEKPSAINISVDAASHYTINRNPVPFAGVEGMSAELRRAAAGVADPVVIISADADTPHQAVINVMEAARLAGYSHITFATQSKPGK